MAKIKINNLCPVGSELFLDSESYLKDLSEEALNLQGGQIYSPELEREQTLRPTSLSFCVEF
jgi:hypothetical protein